MTVSLLLVLFSAGKRFRTLVLVMLVSTLGVLALAGVGLGAGFTYEESKVGTYGTGYGLGMIHANTWGLLAAQALFLGWYLFLRKSRPWMVCGLFWAAGIFLVLVPKCRTAALMLFLFPVICILLKRMLARPEGAAPSFPRELLRWFLVLTPLTCFLLTAFLGIEREWLVRHTFGTYIENFSKRFIQAGIAFKRYGFPLLGTAVDLKSEATEKLAGIRIPLYVLDNAYAYYGITRGMVWLLPALGFLCYANHLAIRRRDYAILSLSVIFSLTALMERLGLDVWYNCVLLFPLSAAAAEGEAGTLPVPEPDPPGPEPPGSGAEEC